MTSEYRRAFQFGPPVAAIVAMAQQGSLLDARTPIEGLIFQEAFITPEEELTLLDRIRTLDFHDMKMRGVVARRRVIHYGVRYSFETFKTAPGPPMPDFLQPLRAKAAALAGVDADDLAEALITEYSPGASIGWHKDAHPFGIVVGMSLLSASRFRFRRGKVRAWETAELPLPPRSAYVLTGPARTEWEHSIPAVKELRYSVTFRTLRARAAG